MLDERLLETKLGRLRVRVERVRAKLPASREDFESDVDAKVDHGGARESGRG